MLLKQTALPAFSPIVGDGLVGLVFVNVCHHALL